MSKLEFPEVWDDDTRTSVLFAPFRPKNVNPENYTNKLEFWESLIYSLCKQKKNPCFSKQMLEDNFKRKNKIPNCLDLVIQDMTIKSIIRKENDFMLDPMNGWTNWAINNFVKNPIKWSLSKVIKVNNNENNITTSYIHLSALQELSNELNATIKNYESKIFSYSDFLEILNNDKIQYDEIGLKFCLYYLHCIQYITLDYVMDKDVKINLIKVPGKCKSKEITTADRTLIKLQDTRKVLYKTVQSMEKDINDTDQLIRQYLRNSNKKLAKIHLKRKHNVEKNFEKKTDVLNNIDVLISNIEDTQSNGEILSAYKIGSDTLKLLTDNSGLTLDNVDEIMLTMKEVLEDNQDIQKSIGNVDMLDVNDSLLEQELEDLMSTQDEVEEDDPRPPHDSSATGKEYEKELINILDNLKVVNQTISSTEASVTENISK